jgi:hypothetical protein
MSFSLAYIDPEDIRANDLGIGDFKFPGQASVSFHTTNYAGKIIATSSSYAGPISVSEYIMLTNDWFAPKFAKALKHAVELCGGKRSSF